MRQISCILVLVLAGFLQGNADANEFRMIGTLEQAITINQPIQSKSIKTQASLNSAIKKLKFMEWQLSESMRQSIEQKIQRVLERVAEQSPMTIQGSKAVQLGMNNVPVLDQGRNGTCVTFAITAGLDAILSKGDYVSQLCLLQLGNYLEKQGLGYSGWDGSFSSIVLKRIDDYGVMNVSNQKEYGCGGLTKYPSAYSSSAEMTPEQYGQYSETIRNKVMTWHDLLKGKTSTVSNKADLIKSQLKSGHRVAIGVLLPGINRGVAGAVGWHNHLNDSWVLSYAIVQEMKSHNNFPGHEMVITGYDDNAVAMDGFGYRHHGLFTLRNSWGESAGDHGNFYMSYDYVNSLVLEAMSLSGL